MNTPPRWPRYLFLLLLGPLGSEAHWPRHTIDGSSQGADGVRLADVNGDGQLDVTTGWEEGGLIRIYLHPGPDLAKQPWPVLTVGRVRSPEDAVFIDLNGDQRMDVVSSCEGKTKSIYVHWAPPSLQDYTNEAAWRTNVVPSTQSKEAWMFALPWSQGPDRPDSLIVGSKGANASVSQLQIPEMGRPLEAWRLRRLYEAGWIMSLRSFDLDNDGDLDILVSDRKGPNKGVLWLENPVTPSTNEWKEHRIGADNQEVMFLDVTSAGKTQSQVQVAVFAKPATIFLFTRLDALSPRWQTKTYPIQAHIGTAKAVRLVDINQDDQLDIVATCEHATEGRSGVFWFPLPNRPTQTIQQVQDISGPEGIKFDRIELADLDQDGDLDVITCEENKNLGVIWYENPHIN